MDRRIAITLIAACLSFMACSSSSDSEPSNGSPTVSPTLPAATATPTAPVPDPTATVTATPVGTSQVIGLAVFGEGVDLAEDENAAAPPEAWLADPDAEAFPRALGFADWTLEGPVGRAGSTGADGSFAIPDLPLGEYALTLTRTLNGSLVEVVVSFSVGADGPTELLLQIDRDTTRAQAKHVSAGRSVRAISGPDGTGVVIEDGRIIQIKAQSRHWIDVAGDGRFVDGSCGLSSPYLCSASEDCADGLTCQCTASCPFCDDCGPNVCAAPMEVAPYRCSDERTCERPGDACVCVPSCPDCLDCPMSVCVPSCEPVQVESVEVSGADAVTLGRRTSLRAVARFDDGREMDVTTLARWESSDPDVVTVDSWGHAVGRALGGAEIRATFGTVASVAHAVEVVQEPALVRLEVNVLECMVPGIAPGSPGVVGSVPLPHPGWCSTAVRVGGRTTLMVFASYADNSLEDVTERVSWSVAPESGGQVSRGIFHALEVGEVAVRASLDGVESAPLVLRVVDRPAVVALYISPESASVLPHEPPAWEDGVAPTWPLPPIFCPDCHGLSRVVLGDSLRYRALAHYETGDWEDVTELATWVSDAPAVADFVEPGVLATTAVGETAIVAEFDGVSSLQVVVDVVAEATLHALHVFPEGRAPEVVPGDEVRFHAWAVYDVGASREATDEVAWQVSDSAIASFAARGVLVAHEPGSVDVWASLDGVASAPFPLIVSAANPLAYCDPNAINRASGSDGVYRIVLESDCARYTPPDVVHLRYDISMVPRPDGEADPCIDIEVQRDGAKVRTLRTAACDGADFAPRDGSRLPLEAHWDLRDDTGRLVEPGVYVIAARPHRHVATLVRLTLTVGEPDGRIPCRKNSCGNGCGYVHACGATDRPTVCPAVCVELCECPAGWGITPDGNCEACAGECCPENARCTPDLPPCAPTPDRMPCQPNECGNGCGYVRTCGDAGPPLACPRVCVPLCECPPGWGLSPEGDCVRCIDDCCRPGEVCPDDMRTCEPDPDCCPFGQLCDMARPACPIDCCPPNARCTAELPPCEVGPACCPEGALCIVDLPPCPPEPECCPEGQECPPNIPPCDAEAQDCRRTGCSGQVCADRDVATTCEFLPEYACYQEAECERQADGLCGWTPTEELQRCIETARDELR